MHLAIQYPMGAQPQPALFKRSKSQQAEHVPKPNKKSKAFRNGFNYSEAAKQGRLQNKAACPEAFSFQGKELGIHLRASELPNLLTQVFRSSCTEGVTV